jgi:alpha-tubulin suppressor-like RCC1 family protein
MKGSRVFLVGVALLLLATVTAVAAPEAVFSAHLTKTFFTPAQAGSVKLVYRLSKPSRSFAYQLSRWNMSGNMNGWNWQTIRKVTKKGTFRGRRSLVVKKLFGGKPVQTGDYRLKLSFGRASTYPLFFEVVAPRAPKRRNLLRIKVHGITNAKMVSAGDNYTCVLLSGGTIECWGDNESGKLGDGVTSHSGFTDSGGFDYSPEPVQVKGVTDATEVAADASHTCAVLATGVVDCWGWNLYGQLGNGQMGDDQLGNGNIVDDFRPTPVQVVGITDAVQVAAGYDHTCAVLATGVIDCWGNNRFGQLGDGVTDHGYHLVGTEDLSPTPVQVVGITNAVQVSAGGFLTCAVLNTGTIKCWGSNLGSQLGDGVKDHGHREANIDFSPTPVQVKDITNAIAVSGDCALLASGRVECWDNDSPIPWDVANLKNAIAISIGSFHSCALLSTGTAKCWGSNSSGELGDGTTESTLYPVPVRNLTSITSIGVGDFHTCAVLSTGSVECWGRNNDWQLGAGDVVK